MITRAFSTKEVLSEYQPCVRIIICSLASFRGESPLSHPTRVTALSEELTSSSSAAYVPRGEAGCSRSARRLPPGEARGGCAPMFPHTPCRGPAGLRGLCSRLEAGALCLWFSSFELSPILGREEKDL